MDQLQNDTAEMLFPRSWAPPPPPVIFLTFEHLDYFHSIVAAVEPFEFLNFGDNGANEKDSCSSGDWQFDWTPPDDRSPAFCRVDAARQQSKQTRSDCRKWRFQGHIWRFKNRVIWFEDLPLVLFKDGHDITCNQAGRSWRDTCVQVIAQFSGRTDLIYIMK